MENSNAKREKDILRESEKWLKDNPEKAKRINEAYNLGLFDNHCDPATIKQPPTNTSIVTFRKDYKKENLKKAKDDYIKAFNDFYITQLREIENKRGEIGFSDYLNDLKPHFLMAECNRLVGAFPKSKRILKFSAKTMEALQIQIKDELSRLEREKSKSDTKGKESGKSAENSILAFNNVEDALYNVGLVLEQINYLLFENSNEKQWSQFLKGEQLTETIVLRRGITLSDIKYFLDEMERKVIWKAKYTTMENIKAFRYRGKVLTAKQISGATTQKKVDDEIIKIPAKHKTQIDLIISILD